MTAIASASEICRPGGPLISCEAAISQAVTTTKPGLRNSEGCTEAKPNENHRTAPLPKSVPRKGRSMSAARPATKPMTPMRRTSRGESIETPTIATRPRMPKKICRST